MSTSSGITRSKVCIKCGVDKLIDAYGNDSRTPDGRAKTCIDCRGNGKRKGGGSVRPRDPKPERVPAPAKLDGLSLEVARGYGFRASAEDGQLVIEQDTDGEGTAQVVLSKTEFKVLAAQFAEWADG